MFVMLNPFTKGILPYIEVTVVEKLPISDFSAYFPKAKYTVRRYAKMTNNTCDVSAPKIGPILKLASRV